MKEVFDVDVWCELDENSGVRAKDLDFLVDQLKDLSGHCIYDGLGLRRFRIDDDTEILSDDETDYDEESLVIGQISVYGAFFTIEDAKEFIWSAKDTFWAFGISCPHYTING